MGMKPIPETFLYTCDGCNLPVTQNHKGRPKYWSELNIIADCYDWQGSAVANGSVKRMLCEKCTDKATKAINEALK